jgi:hypothetical protein
LDSRFDRHQEVSGERLEAADGYLESPGPRRRDRAFASGSGARPGGRAGGQVDPEGKPLGPRQGIVTLLAVKRSGVWRVTAGQNTNAQTGG